MSLRTTSPQRYGLPFTVRRVSFTSCVGVGSTGVIIGVNVDVGAGMVVFIAVGVSNAICVGAGVFVSGVGVAPLHAPNSNNRHMATM